MAADDRLHLLGIRHHGPGSARAVLAALDLMDPAAVLIEGPPDADEIIAFAAADEMTPPVAILVHAQDDPANASFFPFAAFSPEWQAMRWALARGKAISFIDLPMANRLAERAAAQTAQGDPETDGHDHDDETDGGTSGEADDETAPEDAERAHIRRDPLAFLARLAGYDDSEAWWNALIEQGAAGPEIFQAIEAAMGALREHFDALGLQTGRDKLYEDRREAHMRRAIADTLAKTDGAVAVVCGAWHVPALRAKVAAKADRDILKGLARTKVTATWVPWTQTRLASMSGYGAGVTSPGWYQHLWHEMQRHAAADSGMAYAADTFTTRWQARVAELLRRNGRPASTASVIEASRLALSLASLRDLALPGLEEMREASLATLCEGESAPFRLIEEHLVIGKAVGEIPEGVPQMPLAADLARWQKKLKLKPEAIAREISLDLRSDAGRNKSLLLHRLGLINVPWGRILDAGRSRGSFRENWRLEWQPEFSVQLAEALVFGTTVEQAAANAALAAAHKSTSLDEVAGLVQRCLDAGLEDAAAEAIALLQKLSTASADIGGLAGAIPPLVEVMRYGTARAIPAEALGLLVTSLTEAVCAGLVYGCRNLQREPAADLRGKLARLDVAMTLIEDAGLIDAWQRAVAQVSDDNDADALLKGQAVRMLYDRGCLGEGEAAAYLSRALSPAIAPDQAGDWVDGFLGDRGQILLHDDVLRGLIDQWLAEIGEEAFTALLPVLRRAFSSFDMSERRRLLDLIVKTAPPTGDGVARARGGSAPAPSGVQDAPGFDQALPLLYTILGLPLPNRQGGET